MNKDVGELGKIVGEKLAGTSSLINNWRRVTNLFILDGPDYNNGTGIYDLNRDENTLWLDSYRSICFFNSAF